MDILFSEKSNKTKLSFYNSFLKKKIISLSKAGGRVGLQLCVRCDFELFTGVNNPCG